MKVLPFTIPVSHDRTVILQEEELPYFYPHLHRHQEIQLTFIERGEGTLLLGNHMHRFSANQVVLIGANMPHVFKNDPEYFKEDSQLSIKALTLFFNPKGKLLSTFDLPEFNQVNQFVQMIKGGFSVPPEYVEPISERMKMLNKAEGIDQLLQFFQLLKVFSRIDGWIKLAAEIPGNTLTDQEGERISNIYHYILQHYSRDITLDEVAAAACMTPQAFCRYFKKHTRLTFISFLNEVRVNEACKKLVQGNFDSMSSIAFDCGFNSITNFNRVFKSLLGVSPREYVSRYFAKVGS